MTYDAELCAQLEARIDTRDRALTQRLDMHVRTFEERFDRMQNEQRESKAEIRNMPFWIFGTAVLTFALAMLYINAMIKVLPSAFEAGRVMAERRILLNQLKETVEHVSAEREKLEAKVANEKGSK
ncbi:MAG TPA: hypothetical protein VL424_12685 [Pararobbsia sp.]|nr:hypothetical protein [Pararobbsia sp.]